MLQPSILLAHPLSLEKREYGWVEPRAVRQIFGGSRRTSHRRLGSFRLSFAHTAIKCPLPSYPSTVDLSNAANQRESDAVAV